MKQAPRWILSLFAGSVAAMLLIVLLESASQALLVVSNPTQAPGLGARGALLLSIILAHVVATGAGAALAVRLAPQRPRWLGWVVGLIVLSAAVTNLWDLSHPLWFAVLDLTGIAVAAWYAADWAARRSH